jgi:hypothetical protein
MGGRTHNPTDFMPPITFHDARQRHRHFWLFCLACGRTAKREIQPLIAAHWSMHIEEYRRRAVCAGCRSKRIVILMDDGSLPMRAIY